jgi:glycerophosphoryl diester phosphodiesterase
MILLIYLVSSLIFCRASQLFLPLCIGHRGAPKSVLEPDENTMLSFRIALADGADGIELDVGLTQDEVEIVMHDETLDRTTNGTGKVIDVGYFDYVQYLKTSKDKLHVPRMLEVFELLFQLNEQNIFPDFIIDYKGTLPIETISSLDEMLKLMKKMNDHIELKSKIYLGLYNKLAINYAQKNWKHGPLMLITKYSDIAKSLMYLVDSVSININILKEDEDLLNQLKVWRTQEGKRNLAVWTVNSVEDLEFSLDNGIDSVITDNPAWCKHHLLGK